LISPSPSIQACRLSSEEFPRGSYQPPPAGYQARRRLFEKDHGLGSAELVVCRRSAGRGITIRSLDLDLWTRQDTVASQDGKETAMLLKKHYVTVRLVWCVLAVASVASAQDTGIHVRSVRVLATDPEAIATFYEKAFGMSETRRAANTATF